MSTPDLTNSIPENSIKNGASILLTNKTGLSVFFDNSKDIEQGLSVFDNLINNRFDDTTYYIPRGTPS